MFKKSDSIYVGESNTRMKLKLMHLNRELVLDAIRNVQRVEHFKKLYSISIAYEIGDLLYKIRSKFARMTRLLILSNDNLDKYKHNEHIDHLTEIQKLAMEIDALVEIMEDWEASSRTRTTKRSKGPRHPTKNSDVTWGTKHSHRRQNSNTSMTETTKARLRKTDFNYEGFDSDFY